MCPFTSPPPKRHAPWKSFFSQETGRKTHGRSAQPVVPPAHCAKIPRLTSVPSKSFSVPGRVFHRSTLVCLIFPNFPTLFIPVCSVFLEFFPPLFPQCFFSVIPEGIFVPRSSPPQAFPPPLLEVRNPVEPLNFSFLVLVNFILLPSPLYP